jgi:hypothetical protein
VKAIFSLTSTESKRLIAKAVAQMNEVKNAMKDGKIIIGGGTTNGFVLEELTGNSVDKANFTFGIVNKGIHCITSSNNRRAKIPAVLVNGQTSEMPVQEVLKGFTKDDVFIKGANAVDPQGNIGILVGSPVGGTIGGAFPTLVSRKSKLIVPVGLEKLIPSVYKAASFGGMYDWDYSLGMRCSLWPVSDAIVVTEIEALSILADVNAILMSAGGTGLTAGAVTIAISGNEKNVKSAFDLIKNIKGEPALADTKRPCSECDSPCNIV